MTTSYTNNPEAITTAVVSIRIPSEENDDLITDAKARLSQPDGIADVTIESVRSLEPRLSATILTLGTTFRMKRADVEVTEQLADVPGFVTVEWLDKETLSPTGGDSSGGG